jgi:hypothetical protein
MVSAFVRVSMRWLAGCAFAVFMGAAGAAIHLPFMDDDDQKEELDIPPPAYPKAENLLRFEVTQTGNEVFVDTTSLVRGADDVFRYVLLVRGSGGAENVTYEGMRCGAGQRKTYAFGRRDHTWMPARGPQWRTIGDAQLNRYYFELWRDVFCDGGVTEPLPVILRNLKQGGRTKDYSTPSD